GSDMIASIVKNKYPRFSIGTIVVGVDLCVILLSLFTFNNGIELVPYMVTALMVSLITTDFVNEGYRQVRAFNIVTSKPEEVSNAIMQKLSRGCTTTKVIGMHTKVERYNVLCLISKFQSNYLRRILKEVDEEAFVYSVAVNEVIGEWAKQSELPTEDKLRKNKIAKKKNSKVRSVMENEEENNVDNSEHINSFMETPDNDGEDGFDGGDD
ncbi:MAG: YitT family protein, partial [Christensenellales bacterium]